ncbi:nitrate- and nitrite sensing domain-containing protein [Streptomyces sp. RS10V-4]|uniref:sensor histidine kinase n=1 Tax=Streptomyces rhizoryzae TaxID=2932493 RepID=UPI002002AE0B|nr:nitrate- and nitrite sensing domain-containing protein [Streptomyces rhizoryzae]MCK7623210.1 nitrate- and nitrite sensing domain-containing protein [Streptomyces rhizoryzae]
MTTPITEARVPRLRRAFTATVVAPRSLRAKLIRILAVALVILLALLGLSAARQAGDYGNAATTAADAHLSEALQGFIHEHQKERGLTTGYVGGITEFRGRMLAQRKLTDTALAAVRRELADREDSAAVAVRQGLLRVRALPGVRAAADRGTARVEPTYDYFTGTNVALNRIGTGLVEVRDAQLRADYQALQVIGGAKEFTGQERAIVLGSLHAGRFLGDDYTRFMTTRSGRLAALEEYPEWATARQQRLVRDALATPSAKELLGYEKQIVAGRGTLPGAGKVPPGAWYDSATATIDGLRAVQRALGTDIKDRAAELEQDAARTLALFAALAAGSVAALGGLAVGAARSVSGPLGSLTRQAREVAGERLPAAVARVQSEAGRPEAPAPLTVPRGAGSEVRQLADAFDQVQQAAYDLATEQAVLRRNATESLVNLGRRNQNLVRRQISFINKLEHEDADPATLANLFELDHLATRMRRNAESLLVLAGEASPRTWATPLSVTDVIRAALSEVEEYRRVKLRRVDAAFLSGTVVSEISHLLAELVENALSFSPPDTDVEVEGRRTSAGYLVAIVDHGTGMDAAAMAEANVRLSGAASFMAEPTRFLGHFVVGALARKCGIEVRLGEAPAAGTVARVLIPAAHLAEPGSTPAPGPAAAAGPGTPAAAERNEPAEKGSAVSEEHAAAADGEAAAGPQAARSASGGGRSEPLPRPRQERDGAAERPAAAPAAPAGPRGSSAARTRNGLVKRARRSAIQSAVDEAAAPRWQQQAAPTPDRSPDEVSGMLATLRSAHMRGGISVEKEREREQGKGRGSGGGRGVPGRGQDERAERTDRAAAKGDQK